MEFKMEHKYRTYYTKNFNTQTHESTIKKLSVKTEI